MAKTKKRVAAKKNKFKAKARPAVRVKAMPKAGPEKKLKARKMKKMAAKDLKKYKLLLIKMRTQIGGDLSHITENTLNKSARDASGDLSGYSYHMADTASDDYERDFSLGRATEEQKSLYSIEEAMKRIEDGTYGNCLQCFKPISKKRLVAMPQTGLCIECQKMAEEK